MSMKILILSSGKYGSRIIDHIAEGFSAEIVGIHEVDEDLPEFIDDISDYIPEKLPDSDLVIATGLKGDINLIVPEIARKTGARSIIISIHDLAQIPPGLKQEIEDAAGDLTIVFAKPFCSLRPVGDDLIDQFTAQFGKPDIEVEADDFIKKVTVKRDAPCGCTSFVAQELEGIPTAEAEFVAANKFHNYPCLASMNKDPELGDTILHVAGYQSKEAVKKALGFTEKFAVVDQETCEGGEDCDHLCRDICPQVKVGEDTIIIQENNKAYINPASCGCCELCIPECPYGSIELVNERIYLKRKDPAKKSDAKISSKG